MGKNEHRSKAEDFEFEVSKDSKLNFCRLIIAEEKITMITQRKMLTSASLECHYENGE